jgi:hypothetical protein
MPRGRSPKPLSLTFNVEVRENPILCSPSLEIADIWIGSGEQWIGPHKFRQRRFVRVRNSAGFCKYYLYTSPNRGRMQRVCLRFIRKVQITEQQFLEHFGFPHTVEVQQVKKRTTQQIIEAYVAKAPVV